MAYLTHAHAQRPKPHDNSDEIFHAKVFEEEMLIETPATNLLQIFNKILLYSQVIVKSVIDLDDNF